MHIVNKSAKINLVIHYFVLCFLEGLHLIARPRSNQSSCWSIQAHSSEIHWYRLGFIY